MNSWEKQRERIQVLPILALGLADLLRAAGLWSRTTAHCAHCSCWLILTLVGDTVQNRRPVGYLKLGGTFENDRSGLHLLRASLLVFVIVEPVYEESHKHLEQVSEGQWPPRA